MSLSNQHRCDTSIPNSLHIQVLKVTVSIYLSLLPVTLIRIQIIVSACFRTIRLRLGSNPLISSMLDYVHDGWYVIAAAVMMQNSRRMMLVHFIGVRLNNSLFFDVILCCADKTIFFAIPSKKRYFVPIRCYFVPSLNECY